MRKLTVILFFFLLTAFVLEFSLNIHLSAIEGLSFKNVAIYSLILQMLIGNSTSGRPVITPGPVNVPAMLFVVYCTASLFLTGMFKVLPNYSIGQELLQFKVAMDPYVLLVIIFSVVHDERTIKTMLRMLVGVFLVFLAITVLGSFNIISTGRVYISDISARSRGAFSEWNQFPLYVVSFIPLVTALMMTARNKAGKLFYGAVLAFGGYNVLLAGSRGGLVSLAAAVGVYYLLASRKPLATKIVGIVGVYVVVLVMMLALYFVLPESVAELFRARITGEYYESGVTETDYSSGRIGIWEEAWKGFMGSPIYGTGWRTFVPLFGGNSHNDYLLYLVTTGVIGFFLFMWVFVRMLKTAFRHRRQDPAHRQLYDSFIAGLAAYMTGSFLVNVFTPAYFVFIYAALILRLGYVAQETQIPVGVRHKVAGPILARPRNAVKA